MTATGDFAEANLGGYAIHAADGQIGRVGQSDMAAGVHYLVVVTGPWLFGKTVLLPASVIERVDHENQVVDVSCTTHEIKSAPKHRDDGSHRVDLLDYYKSVRLGPIGGQV